MFFNYLFYFGLCAALVLWRGVSSPFRPFVLLAFNLFCLSLFFSALHVLLGVAILAYIAILLRGGRGSNAFFLVTLVAIFVAAKAVAFPAGLSFVLFSAIGFLIDSHRGLAESRPAPIAFAAAITFAPFLSAGPFVPLRSLMNQVLQPAPPTGASDREAALLFAYGLAKKTFADWIFFAFGISSITAGLPVSLLALLAIPAYLFADFSGYSDIARGLALAFGVRIPPNFLSPYLAPNFGAFWRRWHISLGEWFYGYVYQTLVFKFGPILSLSRNMFVRWTQFSALMTAVVVGLWHGVSAKFLFWGLAIGLLMLWPALTAAKHPGNIFSQFSARLRLFAAIVFIQFVFIAPDLSYVWTTFTRPLLLSNYWQILFGVLSLLIALALNFLDSLIYSSSAKIVAAPWFFLVVSAGILLGFCGHQIGETFVYSRF